MEFELDGSLKEWAKDKPLSILQLDPADRAVLRIAGEYRKTSYIGRRLYLNCMPTMDDSWGYSGLYLPKHSPRRVL
ncbi:hypothetical protein ALC53_12329 [Atta colombica]|uniref:Uncharacterized protein n=1 Tax=Atta colombica TaxID=520822 RepID=A0A195AYN6_9HYME|nr:hypothetical protein ALC53_12329 [Atta colombica]